VGKTAPRSERLIGGHSIERVSFVVDRWVDRESAPSAAQHGSLKLGWKRLESDREGYLGDSIFRIVCDLFRVWFMQ
jgi:hypothetical protein